MKLLCAYTMHHAWRGREAWDLRQLAPGGAAVAPGAAAPAAAAGAPAQAATGAASQAAASEVTSVGSAADVVGAAVGGGGGLWVARLTVLPFGREEPLVVESGGRARVV